jgi:ABC-type uncharacterized transport system auxiliary subunit
MRNDTILALALLLGGCLLPTPPAAPRYFTPATPASDAPRAPVAVRFGSVRSPLHLREEMTWRRSEVEYGFYDQRRWTELPATYVERALARDLLGDERGSIAMAPGAPVLTAELRAFEEVLAPVHEARVAVEVEVTDGACVRLHRTFAASRPIDGADAAAVARGIGEALDEVARTAGDAVRRALATRRRCGA